MVVASGLSDYHFGKESTISYGQHARFEGSCKRGDNDMDVSFREQQRADASRESWIETADRSELQAFNEGMTAGLQSEDPDAPAELHDHDKPLDI